jgi:hypothetical protein
MIKDPRFQMPSVFSEIKLSVTPDRAAVFVDGLYVGHVGEFGGVAKKLARNLAPNQKFQIKTDLIKEGSTQPQPEKFPTTFASDHHVKAVLDKTGIASNIARI